MSLLAVLPLWLVYEGLRFSLAPGDRNGAEALITESLLLLGPHAVRVLKVVLALCVLVAGVRVLRGDLPWLSVSGVAALEGAVYGLMLGPVTQALTFFVLEGRALGVGLRADLIGSLGAGLFEEAVFRLGLLSLLSLGFVRSSAAFGLPRSLGVIGAVLVSALAFAWFHHVGAGGEPYDVRIFAFRAVAGLVLGGLFVLRGFAVVVYAHAVYDLHFYLSQA